jgi:hypothetical protein
VQLPPARPPEIFRERPPAPTGTALRSTFVYALSRKCLLRRTIRVVRLSEAERERRSRQAKEMHRRGVLGGKGPAQKSVESRRQKARRASELAQAMVLRHAAEIERALVDALRNGTPNQRLRAAEVMTKYALAAERLDVAEDHNELEHLDREQLLARITAKLTGPTGVLIRERLAQQANVIDAEVVELPAARSGS